MVLGDIFKKRKKKDDFIEIGPNADEGSYGPAQEGLPKIEEKKESHRKSLNELGAMRSDETPLDLLSRPNFPSLPDLSHAENHTIEHEKDLQKLLVKVDNLKITLDQINARLINLENTLIKPSEKREEKGEGWTY
jgi:hypothetical protein